MNSREAAGNPAKTTSRLMKLLETAPNRFREQLVSSEADPSFHDYLLTLMKRQQVNTAYLMRETFISKTYAYQFINGERLPGRDIALRMAFALKLNTEDAQRLLSLAGKGSLYPKIRRDAAVLFCLRKKMTLDEANDFLEELGEKPLL